jgi:hypothetical protein
LLHSVDPFKSRAWHFRCEFEWFEFDTAAEVVEQILNVCCGADPAVSTWDGSDVSVRATHNSFRHFGAAVNRNDLVLGLAPYDGAKGGSGLPASDPLKQGYPYSPGNLSVSPSDYVTGIMAYADSDGDNKTVAHSTACIDNIDGFPYVTFTSGGGSGKGIAQPSDLEGLTIADADAGGTATVEFVMRWHASASWESGNAVGMMRLSNVSDIDDFDGGAVNVVSGATDVMTLDSKPLTAGCVSGATP